MNPPALVFSIMFWVLLIATMWPFDIEILRFQCPAVIWAFGAGFQTGALIFTLGRWEENK